MKVVAENRSRSLACLAGLCLMGSLAGCIPNFSAEDFQRFRLTFELDREFSAGQAELVHTLFFPVEVRLKKQLVRVSGQLVPPDGVELPDKIVLSARVEEVETGKRKQQLKISVGVNEDGSFSARKRIQKNLGAGQLMLISMEPEAAPLGKGVVVTLCVDLVKKAGLGGLPDCLENDTSEPPVDDATLSSLQRDFFTPSCSRGGCHDAISARGGLVLLDGQSFGNLVDVPSTQSATLDRVEPRDPEASYMIRKLRGDPDIIGDRMPDGGPFLSAAQLDRFVRWINDGAPNN